MKNNFDNLVKNILEATMMDYVKAGTKAAIKAPFKGLGYVAKKAIDPRTYLRAAELPGKAVKGLSQSMVSGPGYAGDPTILTKAADTAITKGIGGVQKSIETELQKSQMKKMYGTTDTAKNIQMFDVNYFVNNPSIFKSIKQPSMLKKGDGFITRSKYGGQIQPYKVLANKNGVITAIPAAAYK